MTKKLEGNGLWESSRMVLPEHRERMIQQRTELGRKQRPVLDEQAHEEFVRLIQESLDTGRMITVTVFDPFEDVRVSGSVLRIEQHMRRVLFVHDFMRTWIPFADIMQIESL